MTDLLAAFPLHVPVPGVDGLDRRVTWLWCRQVSGEPLSEEHRAILAKSMAEMPESIVRQAPWIRHDLAGEYYSPVWPSAILGAEPVAENEAGRRLLAADPAAVARELLRVHRTDTPNRWHYLAAAAALRRNGADVTAEARNTLAEALRAECCRLRLAEAAGLDELNTIATKAIERVAGEQLSAGTRAKVRKNPLFWWAEQSEVGHELRFTRALAQELHRRAIRDAEERAERVAKNPSAGIAMPYLTQLVRVSRFGRSSSKMQGQIDGEWAVLDDKGHRVARFVPQPQLADNAGTARIMEAMAALARLSVTRVMRWAVWTAYWQRFQLEQERPHVLAMPGGVSGLAKALELEPSGSTREELVLALDALASIRIDTPRSEGRVFSWNERKAVGRREAVLDAVVFGPLCPDDIDDSTPRGDERQLVPIPLPQNLPALVGRANEHPAQANLQLLVMRHFRKNARHFAEHGSVGLHRDELRLLLDESGTPTRLLDDVLNAYFTGEGTAPGPPQLVSIGPGVVDLHPGAFGRERASIIAAGQASKRGKANRARRRTPGE